MKICSATIIKKEYSGVCRAFHGAGLEGGHASLGRLQRWPGFSFFLFCYIFICILSINVAILATQMTQKLILVVGLLPDITFELNLRAGDFCPATQTHSRQLRFHWQRDLSLPPRSGEKNYKKRQKMGKNREARNLGHRDLSKWKSNGLKIKERKPLLAKKYFKYLK